MTDLTSEPDLVTEPPPSRRWRQLKAIVARATSPNGLRSGLLMVLLPSGLLVALEVYKAASIVPALEQSQARITHRFEVIAAAHTLDRAMQDAERGPRGFLITGDDVYLKPYYAGVRAAPGKLDDLRQLTQDNPEQQRRIEVIG